MSAAFSGDDDVLPAIVVEIMDANLQADAGTFSCGSLGYEVLRPRSDFWIPIIVLNRDFVICARISARMPVITLPCDEFGLTIVIDVVPGQRMSLGKLLINEVLAPSGGAVGLWLKLFVPVETVVVSIPPDKVVSAVFVEVDNQNRATGVGQVEVEVILPRAGEWTDSGLLIPTGLENDVLLLVAVEVAEAHAVAVAAIGYDVSLGGDFSVVTTDEAEDLHGVIHVI